MWVLPPEICSRLQAQIDNKAASYEAGCNCTPRVDSNKSLHIRKQVVVLLSHGGSDSKR